MDERWHMRKDGSRFLCVGPDDMPLRDDDGTLHGFVKITRDLTERKFAEDRLRAAHDALEERVQQRTAELHATNQALRTEIEEREQTKRARQDLMRRELGGGAGAPNQPGFPARHL